MKKIEPEEKERTELQEKIHKIEDAYRRLPILKEAESWLTLMVDEIARLPLGAKRTFAFDAAGRSSTIKELDALAKKSEALAECLVSLHGPAINALAEAGFSERHLLLKLASKLHLSARGADVSNVPENQGKGRREARLPLAIASILAFHYRELTGKEPTIITHASSAEEGKAYGPFLDLVKAVFSALGIEASAEAMARKSIRITKVGRALKYGGIYPKKPD